MKTYIRTYSELSKLTSFEERYRYLCLNGVVGEETFGSDRYLNQEFYKTKEWRSIRDKVILRDNGCDLGVPGYDIMHGQVVIHHMNPITMDILQHHIELILDPEYLITTTHATHNAIHYGDEGLLMLGPIERKSGDTCPWKN